MKLPERLVFYLILAGVGLGLAGLVLTLAPVGQSGGSACESGARFPGPDCGAPDRVVRYTVQEKQPEATPPVYARIMDGPDMVKKTAPETLGRPDPHPAAAERWRRLAAYYQVSLKPPGNSVEDRLPAYDRRLALGLARRAGAVLAESSSAWLDWAGPELAAKAAPAAETEATSGAARPANACPPTSTGVFDLIPVEGAGAEHPDILHGDLNLGARGYHSTDAPAELVDYNGPADPNAPQLAGLFNRPARISAVYRANSWLWEAGLCGGQPHGCAGEVIEEWPVTVAGFGVTPGEAIYAPGRKAEIYGGGYVALVLYAEEKRLTLGYTRRDSVAAGYVIHLENVCVDPNLLALYRSQNNAGGWRISPRLPALRAGQALGTALGPEIRAAIRDGGRFLDPRSRKDWWQG